MKKILLGTTTLVGAAALFAGAAFADTPKITIGGYANFEAGYVSDEQDGSTAFGTAPGIGTNATHARQRPQAFRSDTQVDFKIDGKSDAGLGYGGEIDLLADTTPDVQNRGALGGNASKTFIYMDGSWGRTELGSNVGADGTMKVDAGTIARATGGIDGDWSYFANAATQFIAGSSLPLGYGALLDGTTTTPATVGNFTGDHSEENLNKVTYYTPRFAGVQLGVSYLPDQSNRGQGIASPGSPNPAGPDRRDFNRGLSDNIFTGGINYDNKFGDVGLTLAATGEHGNAQTSTYNDLSAWNVGGKLSYMGFSLAGSYGDWGKSNRLKSENASDNKYWTVGGAYEYGPFGISVTYLDSKFDCGLSNAEGLCAGAVPANGTNDFTNLSVGTDYKLAPGLTPYAEVSWYNEDSAAPTTFTSHTDNRGVVGIIGTQLNF